MKKVQEIPEGVSPCGSSFGTAAYYVDAGLQFSGDGIYEDDDFFVKISKAGKIEDKRKKKESKIGEDKTDHESLAKYYGNQFFGQWYLK